jgi:hypothetical protein
MKYFKLKIKTKTKTSAKDITVSLKTFRLLSFIVCAFQATAQPLSPNGYSGLGITPSAKTIANGASVIAFDPTLPGAKNTLGYNTQIGFGLYEGLELVGRLATNDQKCNMYKPGACPKDMIRDFSASLKWSLPIDWLKSQNANVALGMNDVGGAASYFKSYYVVGSKSVGAFDFSLGQAKAMGDRALLSEGFGSVVYRPNDWTSVSVQRVGQNSWVSASAQSPIPFTQASGYVTLNRRLSDEPLTEKSWVGVGVSMTLDASGAAQRSSDQVRSKNSVSSQTLGNSMVENRQPKDLSTALKAQGFFNAKLGRKKDRLVVQIENTAYAWNVIDAAGVALGVVASTHGGTGKPENFEINITSRGIAQMQVSGEAACVKRWLEAGEVCPALSVRSLLQRGDTVIALSANVSDKDGREIEWRTDSTWFSNWSFRPEVVISPTLVSTIGTEYGSFDMDMGANINTIVPLWTGAVIENNRVKPLGIGTQGFEQGGVFYGSRLRPATNRTLLHQLVSMPTLNTQARISYGTAYTLWQGSQIETSTQSENGRHRLGLTKGDFKNDALAFNNEKKYELATYRYAHDDRMSTVTEITQGKFWGGDRGWIVAQRFWHGDTSLNIYVRRSRMTEASPLVSFAGIQFSIPLTPRQNRGMENVAIRGVNQWTYTLETKVFEKDNRITGGFGEIPKVGDSLTQYFNRDRTSTRYLETSLIRAKSAFNELTDANSVN